MGEFFKNLVITALIVVAATAGASAVSFVAALFAANPSGEWPEPMVLVGGLVIAGGMALLFGLFFFASDAPRRRDHDAAGALPGARDELAPARG